MKNVLLISSIILSMAAISCNQSDNSEKSEAGQSAIQKADWGESDGDSVFLYTLTNNNGTQVKISNYGGTITSFVTKDKDGKSSEIVVGFDSLSTYLQHPPYFGATIGRYGNRIANASFKLDGETYKLNANDGPNTLHGGLKGFDKVVWTPSDIDASQPQLSLSYLSKDGEEGFPGNLTAKVTFTLSDNDELKIEYHASTDKATPINLTNHSYFNLSGNVDNTILNHTLQLDADGYTPVNSQLIPTGEIKPVKGTPFDFTTAKQIGKDFDAVEGGYDHNFVLNNYNNQVRKVATLSDSISGRSLEVYTDQPGIQFYSGNFLDKTFNNRDGKPIGLHSALCLETQHYPDSPNQPNFPSTILKPGDELNSMTLYKVVVAK